MILGLSSLWPEMIEEIRGISDGSGMPFDEVCTVNFVSAIGALQGCTNLVALKAKDGPTLVKTSDIGDDYIYYSVQRVEPEHGHAFLAVSWAGCLWAEVGVNSAGLAVGQGSGPIQQGQNGEGIPTLEYPRMILQYCSSLEDAVAHCHQIPMAGKGLNIAIVDAAGHGAIIEKSGTATAIRYPLSEEQDNLPGTAPGNVYCTNIFLASKMQGFSELSIPGLPSLTDNSQQRLEIIDRYLRQNPAPTIHSLENLIMTPLLKQGLCQQSYSPLMTHFAYMLFPRQYKMILYEGVAEDRLTKKEFSIQ